MLFAAFDELTNKKQMHEAFPNAKAIGSAFLKGYKLVFCTQAAIIKDDEKKVPVAIWKLNEDDLQALEEHYVGFPTFYEKAVTKIEINNKQEKVITYVLRETLAVYHPPHTQYLETMTRGYVDFVLPITELCIGLDRTYKSMNKKVYYWFSPKEDEDEKNE